MLRRRKKRGKWTAAVALCAMLGSQLAIPLADAQQSLDARFRLRESVPAYGSKVEEKEASEVSGNAAGLARGNSNQTSTNTPIKHVVLIIGENRTFDHIFATYQPPAGQTVRNLLSEGIVNLDGTPGPNVALAKQWRATDTVTYSNSPAKTKPYEALPDMNTDGAPTEAHFTTAPQAEAVEPALPLWAYDLLTIGGTGLPGDTVDIRFPSGLPNAPVPMDNYITYDDYAASPVHRFFQMWQQLDCNQKTSSKNNPSGCTADLFPWVETTVGRRC